MHPLDLRGEFVQVLKHRVEGAGRRRPGVERRAKVAAQLADCGALARDLVRELP